MKDFSKIDTRDLKLGMRFSSPVFFDDGENMFLAEEKTVKAYHLAAITRWDIKYLLTYGKVLTEGMPSRSDDQIFDLEELEEIEAV